MGEQKLKKKKKNSLLLCTYLVNMCISRNFVLCRQICAQTKKAGNHQAMGIEVLTGPSLLQRQINSILLILSVFKNKSCKLQL